MAKKIGFDIDGCLIQEKNNYGLPGPFSKLFILRNPPYERMKEILKWLKKRKHEIVAITNRSWIFKYPTMKQLIKNGIYFDKLICAGGFFPRNRGKKKKKVINKERIDIFVENDENILEFLIENSIKSISAEEFKLSYKVII